MMKIWWVAALLCVLEPRALAAETGLLDVTVSEVTVRGVKGVRVVRTKGGEALVEPMRGILTEHGFNGTAQIWLKVSECPPTPDSLPIWAVGFSVADYGPDGAQAVVFDDTRTSALIDGGAYDATSDAPDVNGRVFSRAVPAESWCGANGVFYRLEVPYGRYVVAVDLVVDGDYINASSDPTATQYLGYIFQDLLYNSLGGTLNRGNPPAAE